MCNCEEWSEVYTGDTFGIAARFTQLGTTDTLLTAQDVTSISLKVYTISGSTRTLVDTFVRDVDDVIFDALQTNPQWLANEDSTGFNFMTKLKLDGYQKRYHVETVLTLTNGDTHIERWQIRTK